MVAAPFATVATELGVTAYENVPKLFELGSINENEPSDVLYTPLFAPNVSVEIRGLNERSVVVTQLLDGEAPMLIRVPCVRLLVLSIALLYVVHPVPFP